MKPARTIEKLAAGERTDVVALGDSLTYGWMVGKGYLAFLKESLQEAYRKSDFSLMNQGIPGDTARGGLCRLQRDVLSYDPDCVLVQFALNDAFSGVTPEGFGKTLEEIIRSIEEESEAEIVLVTSVCLDSDRENLFIERYYGEMERLSRVYRCPLARVHEKWKQKISGGVPFYRLVQSDGVHPTSEGYRYMAEAVGDLFF